MKTINNCTDEEKRKVTMLSAKVAMALWCEYHKDELMNELISLFNDAIADACKNGKDRSAILHLDSERYYNTNIIDDFLGRLKTEGYNFKWDDTLADGLGQYHLYVYF